MAGSILPTAIISAKAVIKDATNLVPTSISYTAGALAATNILGFTTAGSTSNPIEIIVPATPPNPLVTPGAFTTAGVYDIYCYTSAETNPAGGTLQNVKQVVFDAAISKTTITATAATDVKVNTAATVKFTVVKNMLYNGDKIIFSISDKDTISEDTKNNLEITLAGVTFGGTEISQSVTFTTKGTYNVWISRDGTNTKQTSQTVEVNASYIAITCALLLGLFLF